MSLQEGSATATVAAVAPRHVVGKHMDPQSGIRVRFTGEPNKYRPHTKNSRLFETLRTHGVVAFLREGGSRRLVGQYVRAGLVEEIEVEAAS